MNLRDYTAKIFEISIVVIALILFYITKTFDIGTWYNITVGIIAVLIVLLLVVVYYDLTHNNLKNKKIVIGIPEIKADKRILIICAGNSFPGCSQIS